MSSCCCNVREKGRWAAALEARRRRASILVRAADTTHTWREEKKLLGC